LIFLYVLLFSYIDHLATDFCGRGNQIVTVYIRATHRCIVNTHIQGGPKIKPQTSVHIFAIIKHTTHTLTASLHY